MTQAANLKKFIHEINRHPRAKKFLAMAATLAIGDMIPWRRKTLGLQRVENPLLVLRSEMNRVFDDVFSSFDTPVLGLRGFEPNIDIETEKVDASMKDGVATIILPKTEKTRAETKKIAVKAG